MCGLAGIISLSSSNFDIKDTLNLMSEEIERRGPDSFGYYFDRKNLNNISIAHRRLSIIDLSEKGSQPMKSKNGRYVIAFNGEIYNHKWIKRKIDNIKSVSWYGTSDTEILLESIQTFGLQETLKLAVGMFAIALLDKQEDKLFLIRDRFGEKPLYYGFIGEGTEKCLVFASELSAINKIPFFKKEIDPISLDYFLRLSYVPNHLSIFKNISKVKAGSMSIFNIDQNFLNNKEVILSWFSYQDLYSKNKNSKFRNENEAIYELDKAIKTSTIDQSVSDVPLGCFLSGGIDSSLIASTLQNSSSKKINTFTIGFKNDKFDESKFAKKVANYLGTNHNEFILEPQDALNIIYDLPNIYSEPFADSSQIPTALISRNIKNAGITVALSGDGGDEVFGGYVRHYMVPNLWKKIKLLPFGLRKKIGEILLNTNYNILNKFVSYENYNLEHKIFKLANRLKVVRTQEELFKSLIIDDFNKNLYSDNFLKSLNAFNTNKEVDLFPDFKNIKEENIVEKMLIWDALGYLPDDILVKVDRASMFYGLETRAPFLDHRISEVASRIPNNLKVKSNYGKYILRKLLYNYIPKSLVDRPKAGFGVPIEEWLKGPLKSWAKDLINSEDGYINQNYLHNIWIEHIEEKKDNSTILWRVLMWRFWLFSNV